MRFSRMVAVAAFASGVCLASAAAKADPVFIDLPALNEPLSDFGIDAGQLVDAPSPPPRPSARAPKVGSAAAPRRAAVQPRSSAPAVSVAQASPPRTAVKHFWLNMGSGF